MRASYFLETSRFLENFTVLLHLQKLQVSVARLQTLMAGLKIHDQLERKIVRGGLYRSQALLSVRPVCRAVSNRYNHHRGACGPQPSAKGEPRGSTKRTESKTAKTHQDTQRGRNQLSVLGGFRPPINQRRPYCVGGFSALFRFWEAKQHEQERRNIENRAKRRAFALFSMFRRSCSCCFASQNLKSAEKHPTQYGRR